MLFIVGWYKFLCFIPNLHPNLQRTIIVAVNCNMLEIWGSWEGKYCFFSLFWKKRRIWVLYWKHRDFFFWTIICFEFLHLWNRCLKKSLSFSCYIHYFESYWVELWSFSFCLFVICTCDFISKNEVFWMRISGEMRIWCLLFNCFNDLICWLCLLELAAKIVQLLCNSEAM